MIELIIKTFYFMLPAYFANMAPVICKKINFLAFPVNEKIFGKNKTYRGLVVAVVFGIVIAYLQYLLGFEGLVDYNNWLIIGFLLGFGAIIGDLVESFFKRRVGIKSGDKWIPFDQLDFPIGALALVSVVFFPGWDVVITALIMNFVLLVVVNHIAFFLKIRGEKW